MLEVNPPAPTSTFFPWNEQQIEELKQLWGKGHSAAYIAGEMGDGALTRSAIIGKVHRLGLAARRAVGPRKVTPKKEPKPTNRKPNPVRPLMFVPPPPPIEPPVMEPCQIMELSNSRCKFPIGDPLVAGFFFCGTVPAAGRPYCAFHCRVAYQPLKPRGRLAA